MDVGANLIGEIRIGGVCLLGMIFCGELGGVFLQGQLADQIERAFQRRLNQATILQEDAEAISAWVDITLAVIK